MKLFDRSWTRVLVLAAVAVALFVADTAVAAEGENCQGGDRVVPVTVFGRPQTTFSREPAATEEDLQRLFVKYEADLRKVLELADWEGDPEALFAAVKAGGAEERSMPPGTEFGWMAFRKNGEPACVKNIMWKGAAPFPAWSISFESEGYSYELVVPKTCLNLSLIKGARRVLVQKPPTCELSASFDREADAITIKGSTDGAAVEITSIREPNGSGDLAKLTSAGEGMWTYQPRDDGRYSFSANARHGSGSLNTDCSATVEVERAKPAFACTATFDSATGAIMVDTSASDGDVKLTGLALPEGGSADVSALGDAGFDVADSLPGKPGDYTYTFSGVAMKNGFEDAGSCSVTVTRAGRGALGGAGAGASALDAGGSSTVGSAQGGPWIFRFFGAGANASGDTIMNGPVRENPDDLLSPFITTKRTIGDGSGLGLAIERLFGPRLGLEFEALFIDLDGNRIFDRGDEWTMTNPGVGFDGLGVGLNYHLTPDKKYDVFVGPFVTNISYDDDGFNAGESGFSSELGVGAKLGADFYFGWKSPWALSTSIRYIAVGAGDGDNSFDVDPLVGTIGFGYTF